MWVLRALAKRKLIETEPHSHDRHFSPALLVIIIDVSQLSISHIETRKESVVVYTLGTLPV